MGGGGSSRSAGSGRGGGDLRAAQEPREEEEARGGAAMRARVCALVGTPQGVGAVLLVGGAIVGAALFAWRRRHRACSRDGEDAKNNHGEQPASEEVLDGGVVEDEQGKFDQSDENLFKNNIRIGANGLDDKATEELHQIQNGNATEELNEIQEEDEIVTDESDGEPVEKFDQNSSRESSEIIADDTDSGEMKNDENSCKSDVENEITLNDTEGVDNSYQSTLSITSPEIVHEEHNKHNDGAQETAPTQITLRTQTVMHQRQFSEEAKTDTVTETAQAELAEGTTMKKNVFEQEEQKPLAEPAELAISSVNPSLPSLLKPSEKKGFANPGWNKTGLKLKQDCTNGELSKGVTKHGVAVVTMDRRAASMAILTLIVAVTIGVNIVMRLYSSLRAT